MKKLFASLIGLLLVIAIFVLLPQNIWAAEEDHDYDNGFCRDCNCYQPATLNDDGYYEISNAGQLYWFAATVNSGRTDICGELTANIVVNQKVLNDDGTLNGTPSRIWTPIGYYENSSDCARYTGIFDGNGKTVSGLYFDNSVTDYVGLFGYVGEDGKVQNLGVIDSYLSGNQMVGGVVGYNDGTVTNCYNTGSVSGRDDVGGVVGSNYDTVTNCSNTGSVSGRDDVGGVVGQNENTVTNCYNTGSVSGSQAVGGVVGHNAIYNDIVYGSYGTVVNCYNTGTVSGSSYVGGVVGDNSIDATVENCYYLNTSASGGIHGEDLAGQAVAMTAQQFASGEVAYLLNGSTSEGDLVWFQTCGEGYPAFEGPTVYRHQVSSTNGGSIIYVYTNNKDMPTEPHVCDDLDKDHLCDDCGAVLSDHSYGNWVVADANSHKRTCSVCGAEEVAAHTWDSGVVTQQPTCAEEGEITYTCTVCKHAKTEPIGKTNNHKYDNDCDKDCNLCGQIRAVTHSYGKDWESDKDSHWHECTTCGHKADNAAHTPGTAATESKAQTCTVCGYVITPALGHTHKWGTSYSTNQEQHWLTCSGCSEKKDAENHKWDKGTVTKAPTCEETGEMTYTCTVCGKTKTEAVDVVEHTPGPEATETEPQVCTVCGKILTPATGSDVTPTVPPTEPGDPTSPPTTAPTEPGANKPTTPSVDDEPPEYKPTVFDFIGALIESPVLAILLVVGVGALVFSVGTIVATYRKE